MSAGGGGHGLRRSASSAFGGGGGGDCSPSSQRRSRCSLLQRIEGEAVPLQRGLEAAMRAQRMRHGERRARRAKSGNSRAPGATIDEIRIGRQQPPTKVGRAAAAAHQRQATTASSAQVVAEARRGWIGVASRRDGVGHGESSESAVAAEEARDRRSLSGVHRHADDRAPRLQELAVVHAAPGQPDHRLRTARRAAAAAASDPASRPTAAGPDRRSRPGSRTGSRRWARIGRTPVGSGGLSK